MDGRVVTDEEHHKVFLKALEASREAVFIVAQWLHRRGWSVEIPAISHGEKRSDWRKFADRGDLFVFEEDAPLKRYRVEVKGLGYQFTGRDDWPHPEYLICATHAYDSADPKPMLHVNLSKDKTHLSIVTSSTRASWYIKDWSSKAYPGITAPKYLCPLSIPMFTSIHDTRRVPKAAHREQGFQAEQGAQVPQQAADNQRRQVRQHQGGEQARRAQADGEGRRDRATRPPGSIPAYAGPDPH